MNLSTQIRNVMADQLQVCVDACRSVAALDLDLARVQDHAHELQPHEMADLVGRLRRSIQLLNVGMTAVVEFLVDASTAEDLPGLPPTEGIDRESN